MGEKSLIFLKKSLQYIKKILERVLELWFFAIIILAF